MFAVACIIVLASLFYSNYIVQKIAQDERNKVTLWAEALKRKSTLVRYTQELFQKLAIAERQKVELWSEATRLLASPDYNGDFSFLLKVIADNTTIPIILVDQKGNVISSRNIEFPDSLDKEDVLYETLKKMIDSNKKIEIDVYKGQKNFLYYKESKVITELKSNMSDLIQSFISEIVINSASLPVILLDKKSQRLVASGNIDSNLVRDKIALKELILEMKNDNAPISIVLDGNRPHEVYYSNSEIYQILRYYPLVQFLVIGLFILFSYGLFNVYRRSEQNQVWAGMAKETAHQLGTPISSLMGWVEYLKTKQVDESTVDEIYKDIHRLQVVADRFSKIGSIPELEMQEIIPVLNEVVIYMQKRCSSSIQIKLETSHQNKSLKFNKVLIMWVLENLIRNSIDSLESGKGHIHLQVSEIDHAFIIDVVDDGKGIGNASLKEVFKPGYTTKKRGWGLGLSLSKRIIEDYHGGRIFVKHSDPAQGTTFRIILKA